MTQKRRKELQRLRQKVFAIMGTADIAPDILIGNMEAVCKWLENGTVPRKDSKPNLGILSVRQ